MSQAMAPIYREVCTIKGRGVCRKRPEQFEKLVTKTSGVWTDYQDRIEREFEGLIDEYLDKLGHELEHIIDGILQKFNIMCDNVVVKDEKEKVQEEELRQKLETNLVVARELVNGEVRDLAKRCKNYSTIKEENALFVSSG